MPLFSTAITISFARRFYQSRAQWKIVKMIQQKMSTWIITICWTYPLVWVAQQQMRISVRISSGPRDRLKARVLCNWINHDGRVKIPLFYCAHMSRVESLMDVWLKTPGGQKCASLSRSLICCWFDVAPAPLCKRFNKETARLDELFSVYIPSQRQWNNWIMRSRPRCKACTTIKRH